MSHYRLYYLDDITLAGEGRQRDEEERQWKRENSTGDFLTHSIPVERSEEEKRLSERYHTATMPQEKLEVLAEWKIRLIRLRGTMTALEREIYDERLSNLLQIAEIEINRVSRRQSQREEPTSESSSPASSVKKIVIRTWKDDIARIHEAALRAGLYSETTEVAQIVAMYHVEKPPQDLAVAYRSSKSRVRGRNATSEEFLDFVKHLAESLPPQGLEELIEYCSDLLARKPR